MDLESNKGQDQDQNARKQRKRRIARCLVKERNNQTVEVEEEEEKVHGRSLFENYILQKYMEIIHADYGDRKIASTIC